MIIEYHRTYTGNRFRCWLCGWMATVTNGRRATVMWDNARTKESDAEKAPVCDTCIESGEEGMRKRIQSRADRLRITAQSVQEVADRLKSERIFFPDSEAK